MRCKYWFCGVLSFLMSATISYASPDIIDFNAQDASAMQHTEINDDFDLELIKQDVDSLIIKDLNNGRLIHSKEPNRRVSPASLTKILTAIIAIESGRMNEVVTITKQATKVERSKAFLREGEKFYLRDLVHSALISSANDSAYAIGIFLGNGDMKNFTAKMNAKAKKIGMKNSHFTNPAGFDINDHYSTARDLLILSEYAIKNQTFNRIVKKNSYAFRALNKNRRIYRASNHNKLLKTNPYAVGIKTGYTSKAGPCLIARAKKGKEDLMIVMLNSKENRWKNAQAILNEFINAKAKKEVRLRNASNGDFSVVKTSY